MSPNRRTVDGGRCLGRRAGESFGDQRYRTTLVRRRTLSRSKKRQNDEPGNGESGKGDDHLDQQHPSSAPARDIEEHLAASHAGTT